MAEDRFKRLLRVRAVQLQVGRAEEANARARVDSEVALRHRIAQLANDVAPSADHGGGFSLAAAAHYRERLHHSASQADARVRNAEHQLDRAAALTREAKRDHAAAEKLLARAAADAVLKDLRKLEDLPAVRRVRHDPC